MTFYPLTNNGKCDMRYSVDLEWCGQSEQRHVLRFCGEWIGQYRSIPQAAMSAVMHRGIMRGDAVIVEKR